MTDNELRHLSKAELIEIIYEQKKESLELEQKIEVLEKKLEIRELKVGKAGSIAEAALGINEVFEVAQKAADDYINEIEGRCIRMLEHTEQECKRREKEYLLEIKRRTQEFSMMLNDI